MKFKNEVMVGLVVLGAFAILIVGAVWLSGKPWAEQQRELAAIFREVGELKEGNPVVYRGVGVGRITAIELVAGGREVVIQMEVSPDIQLPPDAGVVVGPASLFGDWQASIVSRRTTPELEFVFARQPGMLPGSALPDITQLTAVAARIAGDIELLSDRIQIAFTEETARRLREAIENVQEISEQLNGFVEVQTQNFDQVARNAVDASANIETATARVDRMAGQMEAAFTQGDVQAILTNARQASENLRELSVQLQSATEGVPALVARADTTLQSVNTAITGLQPALANVDSTLLEARAAMATLQRAAARIEAGEGTLGRLTSDPALYEETQRAIATLRRLLADLQQNPGKYVGEVKLF